MKPTFTPGASLPLWTKIAHSSAPPCLAFLQLVHNGSRLPLQPLLLRSQLAVLSTTMRTFGTCAGILGLVVKRSVSSPTRSTPAAITEPQLAKSAAKKILRRSVRSVFILFSLLLVLFAVTGRQTHLQALVNLARSAGTRIAVNHADIPIGVLRRDARQRAVAGRRLEKQALRPVDRDRVRLRRGSGGRPRRRVGGVPRYRRGGQTRGGGARPPLTRGPRRSLAPGGAFPGGGRGEEGL